MSAPSDMIERSAFAIYREFIRGGHGTRKWLLTEDGNLDRPETADEAAQRRWRDMPELSRERFRNEAMAALEAA
jgi:hypothetical protein